MREDLTGKKFGRLTVLYFSETKINGIKRKYSQRYWKCLCDCGNLTLGPTSKLKRGEKTSCGCKPIDNLNHKNGKHHSGWCGYEDLSGSIFNRIKSAAKQRKKEFTITIEYCWNLYIKQNGKCALSGLDLYLAKTNKELTQGLNTASLDRIDSSKGYIEGNVQWVHVDVNYMKQEYAEEYFLKMCDIISKYQHK